MIFLLPIKWRHRTFYLIDCIMMFTGSIGIAISMPTIVKYFNNPFVAILFGILGLGFVYDGAFSLRKWRMFNK